MWILFVLLLVMLFSVVCVDELMFMGSYRLCGSSCVLSVFSSMLGCMVIVCVVVFSVMIWFRCLL